MHVEASGKEPPALPTARSRWTNDGGRSQRAFSFGRDAVAHHVARRLKVQVDTRLHHGTDEFGEEKRPSDAVEALQWLRVVLDKVEEIFTNKSPGQKAKVHHRKLSTRSKSAHVINDTVHTIVEMRKTLVSLSLSLSLSRARAGGRSLALSLSLCVSIPPSLPPCLPASLLPSLRARASF